jgi:hypothetical protein
MKNMKIVERSFSIAMILLLLINSLALAYVSSDQEDYSPGSVVTLFGDNRDDVGFFAGETILVQVFGPNGYSAECFAISDDAGAWSCQVTLWDSYLAIGEYTYIATGLSSGISQSGVFTDGNADISGLVTDNDDFPISGALVSCTSGCTGEKSTLTNNDGYYTKQFNFSGNSATITLTVSITGYLDSSVTFPVNNITPNTVNFKLTPSCSAPSISDQPLSTSLTFGDSLNLSVTAGGSEPLSYQWRKDGVNIEGATNNTFKKTFVEMADAGAYDVVVSGQCGSPATSEKAMVTIAKANATCTVLGYSGVYDGEAHGASGSCTGLNGEELAGLDLGSSFTNVPGGTASWTFTDETGNYKGDTGSVEVVLTKADATCTVLGFTGVYDSDAHGATGSCTGLNGEELAGLDLGSSFTNVPGGTASWTFTDETGNYENDFGSVEVVLTKANATCTVLGFTGVYDRDAHGATGSCTGVKGESLAGLILGSSFTNVPGGTANWTFTDVTGNYNDANGSVGVVISKANATCIITGYLDTYDGYSHGASGSCSGIGEDEAGALKLGNYFKDVPGGLANWEFTGNINYNDQSGSVEIKINQAPLTVTADDQTIIFGDDLPLLTFKYSGFVDYEDESVIDTPPTCNVDKILNNGAKEIKCSGGEDNNYSFAYSTGVLTVQAWTYEGFFQPVRMDNVLNTVKGGSTVPLKFEVFAGSKELTDVSVVESFVVTLINCESSLVEDKVDFITTGGTSLRYSSTDGQFIQNWQTPKMPGKCFIVTLITDDGSSLSAFFKLK